MLVNILIDIAKWLLEKVAPVCISTTMYKNPCQQRISIKLFQFCQSEKWKIVLQGSDNISLILWSWNFFFICLLASTEGNFNQFYPHVNNKCFLLSEAGSANSGILKAQSHIGKMLT